MNHWRLRDRLLVTLTAALAVGWVFLAHEASQRYVLTANSARVMGLLLIPPRSLSDVKSRATTASSPSLAVTIPGMNPPETADEEETTAAMTAAQMRKLIRQQIPAVEVIVHIWRWAMWGVGGWLGLMSLLAAISSRARPFMLMAVGVILLSTIASLVAMRLLIDPDYGGMPPLLIWSYIIVAAGQSAWAWVLLIAYRRPMQTQSVT